MRRSTVKLRNVVASLFVGAVGLACARWRFDPAPMRPLPLAVGEPGECAPGEYVLAGDGQWDVDVRLIIDDQGRPLSTSILHGHDKRNDELALDVAQHVFTCTHPLAGDAPRVIPSWPVHFRPLAAPRPVDELACERMLKYPAYARDRSVEGSVRITVALDGAGAVRRAWAHQVDSIGFVEAAIADAESCRFAPLIVEGKGVDTAFRWDVDFRLR
jgi:hypothetical protein